MQIVTSCADRAGLLTTDRDALVKAVSNPSVTRVARGHWMSDGCKCPAYLAGLVTLLETDEDPCGVAMQVDDFVTAFDMATSKVTGYAPFIEIEED